MTNRKLLKLLFIDKIKKDITKDSFAEEAYWFDFNNQIVEHSEYAFNRRLVRQVVNFPNCYSLKSLKTTYDLFLKFKDKDYALMKERMRVDIDVKNNQ